MHPRPSTLQRPIDSTRQRSVPLRHFISAVLATSALMGAQSSNADQQTDDQSNAKPTQQSAGGLEEITVQARRFLPEAQTTATGLAMSIVDTPQAISILSDELFDATGTDSVYEALDLVPGATRMGQGWGRDTIMLRGIPFGSPRVNGTLFPMQTSLEQDAFERVEIVRGPATALYGVSGSFGGEINQILKRPSPKFHTSVEAKAGSFDYQRYTADITGAIPGTDEKLQARVVGVYQDWGRPQKVVDIQNDKNMVMGALSYDFTESTEGNVYYYRSMADVDPTDGGALVYIDGKLDVPKKVPWDNYYFSDERNSRAEIIYSFLVADVSHRFANNWRLKTQFTKQHTSFDGSYYYPFGPAGAYGLGDNEVYFYTFDASRHGDRMTFDVSLGGDFEMFDKSHQFFAALEYHGDSDPAYNQTKQSIGLGLLNIFEGGRGVLSNGDPIPLIDRDALPVVLAAESSNDEYRASLQLLLNLTERLHVLVGGLYEQGSVDTKAIVGGGGDVSDDYSELLGRLSVTYDLLTNRGIFSKVNVYGSYSQGFSPNIGIRDPNGDYISESQEMDQYEIGLKAEMLDGALVSTLVAYDSKITNIAVSAAYLGDLNFGRVLGGERKAKGIEFEVLGQLTPGWNIAANYTTTDTEILDPNYPEIDVQAEMVPDYQVGLYSTYEWIAGPLAGLRLGGGVFKKGEYRLTDAARTINLYGNYDHEGYTRLDLMAGYRWKSIELFANIENATDEEYFMTWEAHPGFGIVRGEPRTYKVGVRFELD